MGYNLRRFMGFIFGNNKLADRSFENSLKDFWTDLSIIHRFTKIPLIIRTEGRNEILKMYIKKYRLDGKCPYLMYNLASKKLQKNYDEIHNYICGQLYSL